MFCVFPLDFFLLSSEATFLGSTGGAVPSHPPRWRELMGGWGRTGLLLAEAPTDCQERKKEGSFVRQKNHNSSCSWPEAKAQMRLCTTAELQLGGRGGGDGSSLCRFHGAVFFFFKGGFPHIPSRPNLTATACCLQSRPPNRAMNG